MFNEVLYLTMTKEAVYKNFSNVADLTREGVKWTEKLTTAESPKSCKYNTKTVNRYPGEKDFKTNCEIKAVFERRMKDV